MVVKIRFNHENKTNLYWRVIVDGSEKLCSKVIIKVPSETTQDEIAPGVMKFHITASPSWVHWSADGLTATLTDSLCAYNP